MKILVRIPFAVLPLLMSCESSHDYPGEKTEMDLVTTETGVRYIDMLVGDGSKPSQGDVRRPGIRRVVQQEREEPDAFDRATVLDAPLEEITARVVVVVVEVPPRGREARPVGDDPDHRVRQHQVHGRRRSGASGLSHLGPL